MLINPQPSDAVLNEIYSKDYFVLSANKQGLDHVSSLKQSTADSYLDFLITSGERGEGELLEIGCGGGDFLCRAAARGFKVTGVEYSEHASTVARKKLEQFNGQVIQGEVELLLSLPNRYDYIVFCDVLEHVRDPRGFLKIIRGLLKDDGTILCVVPSLDSWSSKLLNADWMEFKLEHLSYFDTKTLRSILFQTGFSEIKHFPAKKTLSFDYIAAHFSKHPIPIWSRAVGILHRALPKKIASKGFPITASGIGVVAKIRNNFDVLRLTVVIPVYNEAKTIDRVVNRVLQKSIPGVEIDLIIIESNSHDGSREIIQEFSANPRVRIILQDEPRGKGFAVRAGLAVATGDCILIQDADEEYDVEDYDALLEPLRSGKEAFVLGARHGGGGWKMREFSDQPIRAFILNCGHLFFTFLINIFYGVWLRDPFTMYKVFRRDAIQDINFECDRFDFDHELVIKLIRKGFKPIEIPVNYRSRSFSEGKKVRMFSDPMTWLKAIFKYRFTKI
jgi:SAM-dependent methyltransferase